MTRKANNMACNTETVQIDGKEYIITQFPSRIGLSLEIRLLKLLGPALDKIGVDDPTHSELNFSLFAEKLDDQNVINILLEMLLYARIKKSPKDIVEITPEVFDTEFAGEYVTLGKLVFEIVRVNRFFGKGDILKRLKMLFKKIDTISPPELPTN